MPKNPEIPEFPKIPKVLKMSEFPEILKTPRTPRTQKHVPQSIPSPRLISWELDHCPKTWRLQSTQENAFNPDHPRPQKTFNRCQSKSYSQPTPQQSHHH